MLRIAFSVISIALCSAVPQDSSASVLCAVGATCKVQPFNASTWSARATLVQSTINTTGWGTLRVEMEPGLVGSYAAGFVEGFLTQPLIDMMWVNNQQKPSPKGQTFIADNMQWVNQQAQEHGADPYWAQVSLVLEQQGGLYDGYAKAAKPALTRDQLLYLGLESEIGDIESAVDPSARPSYDNLTQAEFLRKVAQSTHCSAIFKVTPNMSDIFASHDTWSDYSTMLRIFKSYKLTSNEQGADLYFSGYPGQLASGDDYYLTSQKLVVIETTNDVFNQSLFDAVLTTQVPYWIRVTVASRMATSAWDWHEIFYRYNSGTYNNQWMVLDYKQFTPYNPLPRGIFVVSEQLPGYYHVEDQTVVLQRGYWPSYNVPFYDDIYAISGYPAEEKQYGPVASYQMAPRAPFFRRDAGKVETVGDLQNFMLSNYYGTGDPLAFEPGAAIASRYDLDPRRPGAFGSIDSKITSFDMIKKLQTLAYSGPTKISHPPFRWTQFNSTAHFGMPNTYDFDWVVLSP